MRYKRPEDQYRISQAAEMIKELNKKKPCTFSTILPNNKIKMGGIDHSGSVSHLCSLELGHEGLCKCNCGEAQWKGWN